MTLLYLLLSVIRKNVIEMKYFIIAKKYQTHVFDDLLFVVCLRH